MQPSQPQSQPLLDTILNNTTTTLSYNNRDYIILIKKQKNKNYCTLFLTDCSDSFWIEKLDAAYCEKLKTEMNVKTKLDIFARHFVEAFKNGAKIEGLQPNARLKLQLKISQGLIINCPLIFSICINVDQSPEQYKQLIRSFFKQLYQAKQTQIEQLRRELQTQKQRNKQESNKGGSEQKNVEKGYIKSVLGVGAEKKEIQAVVAKNRDLINPHRKKRRHEGLKITGAD